MKRSITCKNINVHRIEKSIIDTYTPKAGDVAVFQVLTIGKHDSIQSMSGHNIYLFEGDQFMGVFGNRYATEQFEGYVPEKPTIEMDILGKGGVVGILKSMHYNFKDIGTTRIKLIGYGVDEEGNVINTKYYNKEKVQFSPTLKPNHAKIILSLGCSMDSGKTTTAAYLCRALSIKEKKVAYIKLTGTHYTRDSHFVKDCGAEVSIDFGYAGFPSTYMLEIEELLDLYQYLLKEVSKSNPEYIVIEIADGILQRETEMLLNHEAFKETIDHVIFSSVDSLSALYGIESLVNMNLTPFALCGVFTASPLLLKEVSSRSSIPVLNLKELEAMELDLLEKESVYI
ncbi:MAG TPA: hypothetical protein VK169_10680 [Saprospiraceae bacterium]|nr:hypothetical protein [Saprospiraceae bacterium]